MGHSPANVLKGGGDPAVIKNWTEKATRCKNKISAEEYAKLRKKTPSQKIRDKVNPEGVKKDPVYGYEVDRFEADHIVSMKEITEMDGFSQLIFEEKVEILNLEDNFIGLGKRTNASKGTHSWGSWTGHSKLGDVPDDVR